MAMLEKEQPPEGIGPPPRACCCVKCVPSFCRGKTFHRINSVCHRAATAVDARVRDDQTLCLQIFVSLMIVGYGLVVTLVLVPVAVKKSESWRLRQQLFSVFEVCTVLYCLWGASLTDPGQAPHGWNGTRDRPKELGHGWCKYCEDWKPPRTHHCTACRRCVARYDHHCDWIDNCVGERNHKYFLLFLWYVTVCCLHYMFCLFHYTYSSEWQPSYRRQVVHGAPRYVRNSSQSDWWQIGGLVGLVVYTIAAVGLLFFAGAFCWCTTCGAASSQTTYDENVSERSVEETFSRGVARNCQEVLGRRPLLWMVPQTMGVTYPKVVQSGLQSGEMGAKEDSGVSSQQREAGEGRRN
eukprot:TRINITY_DN16973_c0_g1_i1.p1 TRINITY_DN16973_c0_g1~~TRINITY_DN16973_c0_g1_i1.p1  ORF type:complete len:371 (+),score=84.23 TRINITY_DN16973_c0_g1_i1:60-1115(+)